MPQPLSQRPQDRKFLLRATRRFTEVGARWARPRIRAGIGGGFGSTTLADALRPRVFGPGGGDLYIPHYWARIVHDGRPGMGRKESGVFVWFRNPADDPRLRLFNGKTPERAAAKRRLTGAEYRAGLEANRRHREAGGSEYTRPMIVTKIVRRGMPPSRFFSNDAGGGMAGFKSRIDTLSLDIFRRYVKRDLRSILRISGEVVVRA